MTIASVDQQHPSHGETSKVSSGEKKPSSPRPTSESIDTLCMQFDAAKSAVESAEQKFSSAKGVLLEAVQDYGYTPTNAEKTTRLEGTIYVADATTSSTVEIDEAKTAELQSELSRLKKPKLFSELFDRKVKHTLKKNAAEKLKLAIGGMDQEKQNHLIGIFASCFKVNTKSPSLSVDLATALKEKEAEAEKKAERKAARMAKKSTKK